MSAVQKQGFLPQWQILDNLTTAVLVADINIQLQYMNTAAETLLQTSLSGMSEVSFEHIRLRDAGASLAKYLRRVLNNQRSYTYRELELFIREKSQSQPRRLQVDCSISYVQDSQEPFLLIELTPIDRILRIAREERLKSQYQATREIVRSLAHEINNPLGGLRGAAQLLERELDSAALREYTQIIINEADRLQKLVRGLLGPKTVPQQSEINIHEILDHLVKLLEAELKSEPAAANLQIQRDFDPSIPPFTADRDQIIQALMNILRNAWQALRTTQNPKITLRTRTDRYLTIGNRMYRLLLRIEIIDNGPGIPGNIAEQIFYPMVTSKHEGSGLGLSITQSLINRHGGLVQFKSQPGATNFSILLPLVAVDEQPPV